MTRALTRNAVWYGLGVVIVYALKSHYSRATSDQLEWILSPTAMLVEWCFGIRFETEAHAGPISREHGIILAPACAGVNFLIIAFSMVWFSIVHRVHGTKRKAIWLGSSGAIAYLLTLAVNGSRIALSVWLHRADIYGDWVTPARVHRIEGVLCYLLALALIFPVCQKAAERLNSRASGENGLSPWKPMGRAPSAFVPAIPLAWYGLVTVVTPTLNQAWRHDGSRFIEHCGFVVATCLMVLLLCLVVVLGSRGIRSGIGRLRERSREGRS